MTKTYHLVGIGNAVVDVISQCEDTFLSELLLQALEGRQQLTGAGGLHRLDDHLIVAARLEDRHTPAQPHLVAILERRAHETPTIAKQRAAQLSPSVLQGEIDMP